MTQMNNSLNNKNGLTKQVKNIISLLKPYMTCSIEKQMIAHHIGPNKLFVPAGLQWELSMPSIDPTLLKKLLLVVSYEDDVEAPNIFLYFGVERPPPISVKMESGSRKFYPKTWGDEYTESKELYLWFYQNKWRGETVEESLEDCLLKHISAHFADEFDKMRIKLYMPPTK